MGILTFASRSGHTVTDLERLWLLCKERFMVFGSISAKNVPIFIPQKVVKGKNVLFEAIKVANAHGCLLGVLRYN